MLRALVVAAVLFPALAIANPTEIPDEQLYRCKETKGDVTVSFKPEITVKELITWASSYTCKEFLYDPKFVTDRKVTIIAPNKLSRGDAWRMFLAALQTVNYTVVSKGNSLRVIDAPTGRKENIKLTKHPDGSDQLVRYVYRPEHTTAEALVQSFTMLKSDAGDVQQVSAMLLITDYASHIKEMIALARLVDVPKGSEGIYLLPLKFSEAKQVSEYLKQLMDQAPAGNPKDPKAPATAPSKIIAETRTNTLIMSATEASYQRAKALVDSIDIELEIEGGAKFHVYKLQSAIAEDLAKTLNDTLGQSQRAQTPRAPNAPPPPQQPAPVPGEGSVEGAVRVIGDKLTNSLIVMSTGRDYLAIKELIRQLDQPRRQVYIEVVILETSSSAYHELGASGHGGVPGAGGLMVGGVQMPKLKSTDPRTLASATGMVGALIGADLSGTQSLFGRSIPSYALMFQALAGNGGGRVRSTTWVLGLDNKETKQSVGIDIPYERGTVQGFGVDPSAVQTQFERKKLPQQLTLTPHIGTDDTVLLDIAHTAEELGEESARGPTWNTRELVTSVVVRDQMTVVVGGLAQERTVRSVTKVPLLGDVPILGHLFKYSKKDTRKTHLLIMLTPYIIKDHADLQALSERKQREHHEATTSNRYLDGAKYQPKLDYTRKRGLVEEINRELILVDEEIAARAALRRLPTVKQGPIQPSTD